MSKNVTIAGAGLVGGLLAVYLAKRGFEVEAFERLPDPRSGQVKEDRSISVALSRRGLRALRQVGLEEKMLELTIPMRGRMIHHTTGELEYQPYGHSPEEALYAVSRMGLVCALLDAAEATPGVKLHFEERVMGIDLRSGTLDAMHMHTGKHSSRSSPVFGCDGAYSAVRNSMVRMPPFDLSQTHLEYGYRDVDLPAGPNGTWLIEKHALHIWPRRKFMLIALPKLNGEFAAELFLPMTGPDSFESLNSDEACDAFLKQHFPDVYPLWTDPGPKFHAAPTGRMVTVKTFPLHLEGKAVLLGDAGHSVVPFFGEGMNSGFEDCRILDGLIEQHGAHWDQVFAAFCSVRKPCVDAIADMALENFIEMRDSVDDAQFLLRKSVEFELEQRFPMRYLSRHYLVSICGANYAESKAAGPIQEEILDQLCQGLTDAKQLDMAKAEKLINEKLGPRVKAMLAETDMHARR